MFFGCPAKNLLYHPSMLLQSQNLSKFLSSIPENMLELCAGLKGTLMYSYFPDGELNAVFGMEDLSRGI